MNTNLRSALALAALLALGASSAKSARYAFAADLPSAGSALLGEQQPGTAAAGAPKAQVAEPTYNFGTALSGPPLNHVFMIKNVGSAPLEIRNVTSSCGCTAAKPSKKVLAPGEVATIAASVDTHFEQGHSLSVVTLTTNDLANPIATTQDRRRDQAASGGPADGRGLRQRPSRQRGRPRCRR